VLFFTSTSKITLAGSGVAFFSSSSTNLNWFRQRISVQTIGPDKINQLRHAILLQNGAGVRAQMAKHQQILAPKFAAMDQVLSAQLGPWPGVATWTKPEGGYFISLDVLPGTAARVVQLAGQAGVALTPAGATFPYGHDPADTNIRLAPSMPTLAEVEASADVLATCILLAAAEHLQSDSATAS
jgi:DNA-binding transcriptional MocR family regulator